LLHFLLANKFNLMRKLVFLLSMFAFVLIAASCAAKASAPPGNGIELTITNDVGIHSCQAVYEAPAFNSKPAVLIFYSSGTTSDGYWSDKSPATIRKLTDSMGQVEININDNSIIRGKSPDLRLPTYLLVSSGDYNYRC
jgi:hypothetical protein